VKSPVGSTLKRIALALTLSILAHTLLLWQWPKFTPPKELAFPPLQAKLEPLPKLVKNPVAQKPKPVVLPPPELAADISPAIPAESIAPINNEPLASIQKDVQEPANHPILPRHAQLRFSVQYGRGTFKVGEIIHVLENMDGQYSLRADTQTTGLAGIFKNYKLTQTSTGSVTKLGLRPDGYMEIRTDSDGIHLSSANFNWDAHKVYFDEGKVSILADQAQDALSLPYQLSQLPLDQRKIPIALSNGKGIKKHFIVVGEETTINTAMGELHTIELHKEHNANEDGLIIWLALEYRLLPVKMQYLDKSGEISANMVITDIRVSDN